MGRAGWGGWVWFCGWVGLCGGTVLQGLWRDWNEGGAVDVCAEDVISGPSESELEVLRLYLMPRLYFRG